MMLETYDQTLDPGRQPEPTLPYHPRWNQLTGSPAATLLLGHILYWWQRAGRQPFCKYTAPCPSAGPGATWLEELGFSRRQFETARRKFATRITRGVSKTEALRTHLVIYWTDRQHRTWYQVNEPLLRQQLAELECPGTSAAHQPDRDSSSTAAHRLKDRREALLDFSARCDRNGVDPSASGSEPGAESDSPAPKPTPGPVASAHSIAVATRSTARALSRFEYRVGNSWLVYVWFQPPKTDAQTVHQITVARYAPLPRPPPSGDIRLPLAP